MDFSPSQKFGKAIFAVREVVHDPPLYQTRGMASAVDVKKKQYLLTWKGVFNENDRALINRESVRFHRSSRCKVKNYQLGQSKIKQAGSFSFIPVEGLKSCNALTLIVPGSALTENDVCAKSFIGGKKFLKFKFEYNQEKKRHKLKGKKCTIEKSAVLGSPIIKDKRVIGVVGEDADGQLIPYFLTQAALGKLKCLRTLKVSRTFVLYFLLCLSPPFKVFNKVSTFKYFMSVVTVLNYDTQYMHSELWEEQTLTVP